MPIPLYLIGDPEFVYPQGHEMVRVTLATLETDIVEIPYFLPNMALRYWLSMDWINGSLDPDWQNYAWWPSDYRVQTLNDFERFTTAHYIAHPETRTVETWYDIEPWSSEEIEVEILRRIEVFKSQIINYVRPRLDAFVQTRQYDNLNDAISYLNSLEPAILAEANKARELRDSFRLKMFSIIKDVEDRIIPVPKETEFDSLDWPELIWELAETEEVTK